jgi:hypothetical protein
MRVRGVLLVAGPLMLATLEPASAAELWRSPVVPGGACKVSLVNELGDVRLSLGPAGATPETVVRGDPQLAVVVAADDTGPVLSVRPAVASSIPASTGVDVSVPTGCSVTVRTTTGNITAWIGPDLDRSVLVATSGEITTDFTIEIEFRYHTEPSKRGWILASGVTGAAADAPELRLTSLQGAVAIQRAE